MHGFDMKGKGIGTSFALLPADDEGWLRAQCRMATAVVERFDEIDSELYLEAVGIDERVLRAMEKVA